MPASKSGDEPRKGIGLIRFLRRSLVTMQRDDRQLEGQSAAVSQSPKAGDTVQTIEQDVAKREAGLHTKLSP